MQRYILIYPVLLHSMEVLRVEFRIYIILKSKLELIYN